MNEPWNGPNNRQLLNSVRPPQTLQWREYGERHQLRANGVVVAVTGAETFWDDRRGRIREDVKGRRLKTIVAVELADLGLSWSEPKDIDRDELLRHLTDPELAGRCATVWIRPKWYWQRSTPYVAALCVDGSFMSLELPMDRKKLDALLLLQSDQSGQEP